MRERWDMWSDWCSDHPRTVLYLLAVSTVNLFLNVMDMLIK